jgi:hypothetical protein
MKPNLLSAFLLAVLIFSISPLYAQAQRIDSVENVNAMVRNDSLIISFNINTDKQIKAVYIRIRNNENKVILTQRVDSNKTLSVNNGQYFWAYALSDSLNLNGKDINIAVKADILLPPKVENKTEKKSVLKFGIEQAIATKFYSNNWNIWNIVPSSTIEFIINPSWSILSGIGFQFSSVKYDNEENSNDYLSIVIPFTADYIIYSKKWEHIYIGGGVQHRFVTWENDPYLNFGQGLNRYVLGVKFETGVEIFKARVGITYVSDITSYSELNEKNSSLGITVGWRLGEIKSHKK